MEEWMRYRGKNYTLREINEIREILIAYRDRSRRFISQEICRRWGWRQPNGVLKDMICRGLLLQLEAQGFIELPPRKKNPLNPLSRHQKPQIVEVDQRPRDGKLSDLRPIELVAVRRTPLEKLYRGLIQQYHYLGYTAAGRRAFGIPCDVEGAARGLLRVVFGSSSYWMSGSLFGMDQEQRIKNLSRVVINTRFLILPWVSVPHLASHLLGLNARRISQDWEKLYHHEVVWLETFVDPERGFEGTCYKAANWIYLGQTTGRGKDDHTNKANRSLKLVFGYPLRKDFRQVLCE